METKTIATIVAAALAGAVLAPVAHRYFRAQSVPSTAGSTEQTHGEDGEHQENGEHDEHEETKAIRLSEAEMKEFDIEVGTARPGNLMIHIGLPGEVAPNAVRLVHIVPPVSGVVREVRKTLGDRVRKGEVMAVLASRELADAKAAFLNAGERVALAEINFTREEDLWKKRISSEQEYLQAKQSLSEARIELRSAEQKLHALGFSDEYLAQLPGQPDVSYTRYEITAHFDGTVIEKHVSLGEATKEDANLFTVADLSSVWVNLSVYQKDTQFIRTGPPVVASAGDGIPDAAAGESPYL